MTPLQIVKFSGGAVNGLVVRCAPELAQQLPGMRLVVTPTQRLLDQRTGRAIRGVEIVELPLSQRPVPAEPVVPKQRRGGRRKVAAPVFSGA